jgi:hypothetical protein
MGAAFSLGVLVNLTGAGPDASWARRGPPGAGPGPAPTEDAMRGSPELFEAQSGVRVSDSSCDGPLRNMQICRAFGACVESTDNSGYQLTPKCS